MRQFITGLDKFATRFNSKVPGAYRRITAEDVRDMTECGLIGRYRYYGDEDIQTIIGILQYEQLRDKRIQKTPVENRLEQPRCKMCGEPLPPRLEGKKGRPGEYCSACEPKRSRERNRKWRESKQRELGAGIKVTC